MSRAQKTVRCALYTRKSSEEGLDQAFSSLDAQREACEAYVKSQRAEGWTLLPARYDDGGISGGTMDRPALKTLLADIERGGIDTIVVYKIDRLTRSLADFARMVEMFDARGVSFVSVTQQFNTTSSMGRLTLNILLSFAQFEREVTGERIRDKIAASKTRGMWMGGTLPLGFDLPKGTDRILRVNEAEACTVRCIFQSYLELGCLTKVREHLQAAGIVSKLRISAKGDVSGGVPMTRSRIAHLLKNPLYAGMIVHKGKRHGGGHPAIVDPALFEAVQQKLAAGTRRYKGRTSRAAASPLGGRIFDAEGEAMTPAFSYGRAGRLYRYYVSSPLQKGESREPDDRIVRRVPAPDIEGVVRELLQRLTKTGSLKGAGRVTVYPDRLEICLATGACSLRGKLREGERSDIVDGASVITVPLRTRFRKGHTLLSSVSAPKPRRDHVLIKALKNAHARMAFDRKGRPANVSVPDDPHGRGILKLGFLAPDIQEAIADGEQPAGLFLEQLKRAELPLCWKEQRALIAELAGRR